MPAPDAPVLGTQPRSVVVAEDEMIVARDLQRSLEASGYRVPGVAPTADGALALVEEHAPDLVLVDIVLRGERDGIWLARALREEHAVPFVFTTSHADRTTVELARQTRPNGYLVKPYTRADVFAAVEAALANYADEQRRIDLAAMAEVAGHAGGLTPSVLRRVKDHVAKNFDRPLALADLAGVAGLSPYHFAHCFKESVGTSPYRYVVLQRVEEAKRLLRHTDWRVSDVAAAVGYGSQGHFATLFKRETGVSPLAYRKIQ
ncbi:MAG: response regulator transcription factor [Bacteroidota bacterium]